MAVILFMFQFLLVIREVDNDYNNNMHLSENVTERDGLWDQTDADSSSDTVVYIGSSDNAMCEIVKQWGVYTKRRVVQYDSVEAYGQSPQDEPLLLCIAGSEISTDSDVNILTELAENGNNMVMCDLPSVDIMREFTGLCKIAGIHSVYQNEVELSGIRLLTGFLLGGEAVYQAETPKDQEMQDMDLYVPWYMTLRGTKTYMFGTLEYIEIENEFLPPLIWRNSYGKSKIFSINGDYMYDQIGLGILDAIIYELQPYELHPIVNAQNLSIANYPDFAMENTEELMEAYARDMRRLQMDLMWPNIIASARKSNYRMTCFVAPQMDYTNSESILANDLIFYLKEINEQDGEAGWSLEYIHGASLEDKIISDRQFFDNSGSQYEYGAAYIAKDDKESFAELASKGLLEGIRTVTSVCEGADAMLSYCTDTIVEQGITADGFKHTYMQDLRLRSLETALGYSNILLDMKKITWPEENALYWEVLYEAFSSNINTYWNSFSAFDKTTLSESDKRVRAFLAMDYSDTRNGDVITVNIANRNGNVWFLLRTHLESVRGMTGGKYQKLEEDVYLICAQEDVLTITVETAENVKFSLP